MKLVGMNKVASLSANLYNADYIKKNYNALFSPHRFGTLTLPSLSF